ncbi:MAG: FtsW/RodA/SpoVE family cell cycle protein, partial [Clostridiales bacterium]
EHHTDFIFSVIGEELGFVGAIMLLILYGSLLMRGLVLAHRAKDSLGKNLIVGIMTMIFFQIFVNVGMTIGVMPITGLPLPFLSYGGSGMLVNMMSMGIVLSVVLHRRVVIF